MPNHSSPPFLSPTPFLHRSQYLVPLSFPQPLFPPLSLLSPFWSQAAHLSCALHLQALCMGVSPPCHPTHMFRPCTPQAPLVLPTSCSGHLLHLLFSAPPLSLGMWLARFLHHALLVSISLPYMLPYPSLPEE